MQTAGAGAPLHLVIGLTDYSNWHQTGPQTTSASLFIVQIGDFEVRLLGLVMFTRGPARAAFFPSLLESDNRRA